MRELGGRFVQRIDEVRIYLSQFALFDDDVPRAIYIEGASGLPTNELVLHPPIGRRRFTRAGALYDAPAEISAPLPCLVEPPGFPPLPVPPEVNAALEGVVKLPQSVVGPSTRPLLVAVAQLLPAGGARARVSGADFEVETMVQLEVRIRVGFLFTPPSVVNAPSVGILTGHLTFGLLHQLTRLPAPPNPDEIVLFNWRAPMTLSTSSEYVRPIASEPAPAAKPFDAALTEIRFTGEKLDAEQRYTLVGSTRNVVLSAPPLPARFLFGREQLTDVEFALVEEGQLLPA